MFWQEDTVAKTVTIPDKVQDLLFKISCPCIPIHHIDTLSKAVIQELPWIIEEPQAGIHEIYIAESGNGWNRPNDIMHLSKRTHLIIRVPKDRLKDAQQLTGKILDIDGYPLQVGQSKPRLLQNLSTIFCHHIYFDNIENLSEEQFLTKMAQDLKQQFNITVKKMLCGKNTTLQFQQTSLFTRSIMLADLTPDESILLQENGIGDYKYLGCGLFIPHKGIKAVNAEQND